MAKSTSPARDKTGAAHLAALRALGVPRATEPGLLAYLDLLAVWSPRVNLTGARTPEERVATLVAPVLPVAALPCGGRVLDVGSGNGSPGLVLALLRPGLEVTLLEPRTRRVAFLREAARVTGREDVQVVRGRHDEYPGPAAAVVLVRALTLHLAELAPLTEPGGLVVVLGRAPGPDPDFSEEASPAADLHCFRRST